jgi:N-acetylglucosamine kinase-like BadF-type ATPase
MKRIVCIDCGASSTKWTLQSADGHLISGSASFLTGHIFDEKEWQRVTKVLQGINKEVGPVDEVVMGVTGLDGSDKVSKKLHLLIESVFDSESVKLMNDMQLAYSAFLAPGEGVFVYGGTGSVAASIDKDGNFHRSGGWGYLIADEGGGFWIGQQALKHVTRQWDSGEFDWSDPLVSLTMKHANSKNWDELRAYVYSGGRHVVASLAPVVAEAKALGSREAEAILLQAGKELAKLTRELQRRVKAEKFVAMGGVFKVDSSIFQSLVDELPSKIELVDSDISRAWLSRNINRG